MSIPEHKIEEVLARVDLLGLVSRHVELKKSGRSYKGRCPFHQEKSASFYVTPEMRRFKCFGCQAGGDAISFVQRYLGKTFLDAVRDLAREAGVDLEGAEDPGARERQQLKEATDLAAEHFKALLWSDEGARARRYLVEERGLSEETVRAFGLGWAPAGWSLLADKLQKAGMTDWGLKAGLISPRSRGEGYFDFFRSRVIIPIRAPEGRPIAFGARLLADPNAPPSEDGGREGPKYLNSKESRLYNKSETLYALDQAREEIRRRKSAVLVEGYFDAIGLHQAGVRHAVALCSTALTAGHLQALARAEAKELVLLLDGDEAGLKAVERLAGPLLAAGTPTRVGLLPTGDDPDTFARREGVQGVERLLASAQPLTAYLFTSILPAGREATFEEKLAALARLRGVAAQLQVGLVRSAFFGAMAAHFGLPAQELEAELKGKAPQVKPVPKPGEGAPGTTDASGAAAPRAAPVRPPDALEAWYVAMVLREPRLLARDRFRLVDELTHPGLRRVLALATSGGGAEDALFEAPEVLKRPLEAAARQLPTEGEALEAAFLTVCRRLKLRRIDEQLTHLRKTAATLAGASELTEETRALVSERVELLALRKRVQEEMVPSGTGTKSPMQPV
ncbi:DNA primase [Aggregicoccus sp. 17bor-14]|uniref:DNA primase n=1 Tax=Myxococcaceae TaxID=31 RepID=UPI00129D0E2A|nr:MULTISPECIES: DNA primase [Myxococcaceae]MBF5042694.1 DNA primase [Simulacricoccus sp. 17bor-14]MRI88462.1 DNA primase [Aggregicoccus sp. 17bor-14]